MTKFRVFLVVAAIAPSAFASRALRQSFIPLVEKWQGASSIVIVTNLAARPTRVTLSWIGGVPRDYSPPPLEVMIHGYETRTVGIDELLHGKEAIGALRITADADIAARAVISSRADGVPASFNATPIQQAIGTGSTAAVSGVVSEGGYRLHLVETHRQPMHLSVTAMVGDDLRGERRYYLGRSYRVTLPVENHFDLKRGEAFTLLIRPVNGSGRLIAAGAAHTASQGMVVSEMAVVNAVRHSLRWPEVLLYGVAGLALTAGAVYSRKR